MCRLQIENNEVGEVGSMFVLAAENKKLITLVKSGSVT